MGADPNNKPFQPPVPDLGAFKRQQKAMKQMEEVLAGNAAIMERIQWIENTLADGPCFCALLPAQALQAKERTCIRCQLLGDKYGDNG